MRGQTEVVTVIMISGVVIALVGAAYFWGVPIINKQTSASQFQTATSFILDLRDRIIDTANAAGGEGTLTPPFGALRLVPYAAGDPDSNLILYEVILSQPLTLNATEVYLGDATFTDVVNEVGTFGEASPTIVTVRTDPFGTAFKATFTLKFRELEDFPNAYLVRLLAEATEEQGTSKISWRFGQNVPQTVAGKTTTYSDVVVDII
ncbi:MAG: hypothetical protein HY369_00800 [Candidatus Aenigmarchaeota archaeon]|nr:hypothetical protein [Candidatus Aenigmarchaeota archaeon]